MPYDIEMEEWHEEQLRKRVEEQVEIEDLDYEIENKLEDESPNWIGRI